MRSLSEVEFTMEVHNEGRAAFYDGAAASSSPYLDSRRSHWVKGWYDAQHDAVVTRAFPPERVEEFMPQPSFL